MKTILITALFSCSIAVGYDLALRDGTVLHDIQLREKTDKGVRLQHRDGVSFVDYSRIPLPDLYTWGFEESKYRSTTSTSSTPAKTVVPDSGYRPSRMYQTFPTNAISTTSSPSVSNTTTARTSTITSTISGQCAAYTKKGYRCSRMAQSGRSYCYQHP